MDDSTCRTCTKCGEAKSLDSFYVRHGKHQARCKACLIAQTKAYAEAHPQMKRDVSRRWRERNPDAVRAQNVKWYAENKDRNRERVRQWRLDNPEAWAAIQVRWRDDETRRSAARAATIEWRRQHPDRVAAWLEANRDKVLEKAARRRSRQQVGSVGPVNLESLWIRANGVCCLCGGPLDRSLKYPDPMSRSLDHAIPLAHGGPHSQENLQWTHLICNVRKGAKIAP